MRAFVSKEPRFSPVKVELVLESQGELDAFYTVAMHIPIQRALERSGMTDPFDSAELLNPLMELGATDRDYDFTKKLAEELKDI